MAAVVQLKAFVPLLIGAGRVFAGTATAL